MQAPVRIDGDSTTRYGSLFLVVGLAILYGPTLWGAAHLLWTSDEYAHGPLVIAVSIWWFWRRRRDFVESAGEPAGPLGWGVLLFGAVLYVVGRSERVWMLEIGSAIPVLSGGLAVLYGWRAVRSVRFAIFFLIFAIPLPGFLVDELTVPLKRGVSIAADEILYQLGYPVARDGVLISLGQYKLLVADACSGLYSMTSLLALAVVYVATARKAGRLRNGLILFSSLPFAFCANVMRVIALALITFYWGDAAGQGFLHGTAGAVTFATALLLLMAADGVIAWALGGTAKP
jgi:exosortase B